MTLVEQQPITIDLDYAREQLGGAIGSVICHGGAIDEYTYCVGPYANALQAAWFDGREKPKFVTYPTLGEALHTEMGMLLPRERRRPITRSTANHITEIIKYRDQSLKTERALTLEPTLPKVVNLLLICKLLPELIS